MVKRWKVVVVTVIAGSMMLHGMGAANAKSSPRSCVKALDSSEQVVQLLRQFTEATATYLEKLSQSAQEHSAGTIDETTAFLQDQTSYLQDLTGTVDELKPQLQTSVTAYNMAATKCRAGR